MDDTTLNAGTGGDVVRSIEKSSKKTQVIALDLGGAGAESLLTTALPVTGTFFQGTQPVSAASLPLPAGAAIEAGNLATLVSKDFATQTTLAALNAKVTAVNTGAVVISGALPAGANAIGKLAANDGVDIGNVDVSTLPALVAGTAKVGGFYDITGQSIDEVGTLRTVNRDFVNASALGNTQVLAAQGASIRIRVLSVLVVATLGVTVKFQSATTDITAGFPLGNNGGMVLPYNPHGWFETAVNEALNINLGIGTATGCQITWAQSS